jgi:hypothetical protein
MCIPIHNSKIWKKKAEGDSPCCCRLGSSWRHRLQPRSQGDIRGCGVRLIGDALANLAPCPAAGGGRRCVALRRASHGCGLGSGSGGYWRRGLRLRLRRWGGMGRTTVTAVAGVRRGGGLRQRRGEVSTRRRRGGRGGSWLVLCVCVCS